MDPAKMKVVDLRSELGALGLDTKGNKPALVERLKKALESKTGKALPDSSILDTSTEEGDEGTPRRAGPAARTRRRSSSTRLMATPAKTRKERDPTPEPIEESKDESDGNERYSPQPDSDSNSNSMPEKEKSLEREDTTPEDEKPQPSYGDDDGSQSPEPQQPAPASVPAPVPPPTTVSPQKETKQGDKSSEDTKESSDQEPTIKMEVDGEESKKDESKKEGRPERRRELTEEEEWEELNEKLRLKEKERLELEKQHAEEDAKKLEALKEDPVKLNRLKRKQEKKARWSNFYKSVEVTSDVLTPPNEEDYKVHTKGKKEPVVETKPAEEPELDESKVTLSWYDSDLNQYIDVPELSSVVPISDGAFAHAWAGARGTHGVTRGRLVYEVRVGSAVTTTEITTEKEVLSSGIRVGWSTDDSSLHLGEGEFSWGYESTGRIVNNSEFKEYGKPLNEKDVIGVYLDLESTPCKMFYTVNAVELGTAFEFDKSILNGKPLFPHILTKNQCYKVNFGYDRYNMITKTKIVRNRIEIPIEQVIEEKKALEAELQRQKDEILRKEKERKDKEKQEREERQRKRKEEREKAEKERKEKEAQEKRDRGEEPEPEKEKNEEDENKEAEKETAEKTDGDKEKDEPKENGDKPKESEPAEAKPEAMETDQPEKKEGEGEVPEVTEEQVMQGVTLDKRIKFVIRYTVSEELESTEACMVPGYLHIAKADSLHAGPRRPETKGDCEVILMVGMPAVGKTYWAKQYAADNVEKRFNILSTGALFDKMKVDCKPFRSSFEGRWDAMVSKCAKCVLKLLEMARGRRRNFILDQTNVYPSAQRRKLREFDGYRRVAVCIVTDDETYAQRRSTKDNNDSKEVPDPAIMDMKANFALPEKCAWIDEVIYPELKEEEAKGVLENYHKEAKAAGVVKERERRERSAGRDAPQAKRHKPNDKRHGREDRDRSREFQRDREDRWGGGGGGGGGGSRWGGGSTRWSRDSRPPPHTQGRFDRWSQPHRGGDFNNRDRDSFRGRGGMGGPPRGDRGPPQRGPSGDRGGYSRDNRGPRGPGGPGGPAGPPSGMDRDKRQGGPPNQGSGSWQRGGQVSSNNRGGRGGHLPSRGGGTGPHNQKSVEPAVSATNDNQMSNQNQQQGWNQWGGGGGGNTGWGNWNNWNQNQAAGWGNWGNWGNWNNSNQSQQPGNNTTGANASATTQQKGGQQQNWANNYTAQQWYQWQQWQQQQQAWQQQGYGQQQGGGSQQQPTAQEAQQAWAQYYQNYGANAAAGAGNAVTGGDKKT